MLEDEVFVCLDCETTGLDSQIDQIIEVGLCRFSFKEIFEEYESLVDPQCPIPESSMEFHHITQEMVQGKPKIHEIVPKVLTFIGKHIIIGHGIAFDIELIAIAADKAGIPHTLRSNRILDTLRMARLYGESPTNSLEQLRKHFNIQFEGPHRAMSDVTVNREVFKYLANRYKTVDQLFNALSKPIQMKTMPLGKHKGRPIKELPLQYLQWAASKNFDQDLLFTLRSEINRRKKGNLFSQGTNPFLNL